jgi:hypothetical protein
MGLVQVVCSFCDFTVVAGSGSAMWSAKRIATVDIEEWNASIPGLTGPTPMTQSATSSLPSASGTPRGKLTGGRPMSWRTK